jgi:hypothetical protein
MNKGFHFLVSPSDLARWQQNSLILGYRSFATFVRQAIAEKLAREAAKHE